MQNSRILHFRVGLASCAVGAVLLAGVGFAAPAHAVEFTARIASIAHNDGTVTLAGTSAAGDRIEVDSDGDGAADTTTTTKSDGAWRVKTHVDGFGEHRITASGPRLGWSKTVTATTREVGAGALVIERDQWGRTLGLYALSGWEPRSRVVVSVDGQQRATTKVEGNGKFAVRVDGVGFGEHLVTVSERFDGTEQVRRNSKVSFVGDPIVEHVEADPVARVVHVIGIGPKSTRMRFVDSGGAPYSLLDGTDWIENVDGTWRADLAYPAAEVRHMDIVAEAWEGDHRVGSVASGTTVPFDTTAEVTRYTEKQLRLAGAAEPGATLAFTDADGSPITDRDGNAVTATVGAGTWQITLDPRRFAGSRVTATATLDGRALGAATVTFR